MDKTLKNAILTYQNSNVISRFTDKYALDEKEAKSIFTETKKFLYLSYCEKEKAVIYDDMLIVDEMWHNFILFTKDYHAFCIKFFGKYLHHLPASKEAKQKHLKRSESQPEKVKQEYLSKMESLMGITYDYFGETTVSKWFDEYPEIYSPEKIKSLIK